MLDKFWEAAGEKLADRWAGTSVPAVIFWLGGLLCWISGHGGTSDLRKVADWAGKQSAAVQLVILLTALLGVAASGVIVQRLATVGLRLIEGYWPSFADRLFRLADQDHRGESQKPGRPVPGTRRTGSRRQVRYRRPARRVRRHRPAAETLPGRWRLPAHEDRQHHAGGRAPPGGKVRA